MAAARKADILDIYERNIERVAGLLASIAVPPETKVPHLTWTVGEVAAHLVLLTRAYRQMGQGAPSPYTSIQDADRENNEMLAEFSERRTTVLGEMFVESSDEVLAMFAVWPDDRRWNWHGGMTLSRDGAISLILGELLMHGWDLAQTIDVDWPISREDAVTVIGGLTEILPSMVNPEAARGVMACYDLRLRGGPRYTMRIANGTITVQPARAGDRHDVHFSVDPVAFLMQGYGRGSQLMPMLQGKMLMWGRKPWLAIKLMAVLQKPQGEAQAGPTGYSE